MLFFAANREAKKLASLFWQGKKTQNAQTTEFSKILLSTNFANMLDSLSDLSNLFLGWKQFPKAM